MPVKLVQAVLRHQHILITDFPTELIVPSDQPVAFDEAGLQLLTNIENTIEFQGKRIKIVSHY